MNRSLLPEHVINGGFPEPPPSEPVRVIAARHAACGEATRVRLPSTVPARAVRRLHCSACEQAYETDRVEELGLERPDAGELILERPDAAERPAPQTVEDLFAELTAVEALVEAEAEAAERERLPIELYDHETDAAAERPRTAAARAKATAATAAPSERRRIALPALPKLSKLKAPKLSLPKVSIPRPAKLSISKPAKLSISKPAKLSVPKLALPGTLKLPKLNPQSRTWRLASIPIAGALVIAALLLLQGGSDEPAPAGNGKQAAAAKDGAGKGAKASPPPTDPAAGKPSKNTELVRGSSFSLALPSGWEQINPPGGATFAAVADDLGADATLWIEEDPKLDFPTFINQSMSQLEALAGSARVIERVPAPTPEATIVRLAADAPAGQPSYEVTLRAAGPYRYYLATSVQPDASREAVQGAELVTGSFTPEGKG